MRKSGVLAILCCMLSATYGSALSQEEVRPFGRRIVGGEKTDIKDHPWQVALQFRGTFYCGGSIIAEKWILTAAHCFKYSASGSDWRAKAGATNFVTTGAWLDVERVIVHEKYNPTTYENDISLVKLKVAPVGRAIPVARMEFDIRRRSAA